MTNMSDEMPESQPPEEDQPCPPDAPENGICVAIPSTVREKMQAIIALSEMGRALARALESANVNVSIQGCTVTGSKIGIQIKTDSAPCAIET